MVITHIMGGLGNQLFQYALGRCLAHKHNTKLKLDAPPTKDNSTKHHAYYRLAEFNVQENFATAEEIQTLQRVEESPVMEGIFVPDFLNTPDNIFLYGFWQNEKYFIEIRDILLSELTLKNPLGKNSANWKEKILSANCAVSLHVRHGDYVTYHASSVLGVVPKSYYSTCLNELRKDFSDITVFVFSDDLKWCKKNLKFDVPTEFVEGCETDAEEMYLMSICKHNIIPNSTFSWWGAWLNQNPDKRVFAPQPWVLLRSPDKKAFIPENWTRFSVDYFSDIRKMLSILVYVGDNSSKVNLTLQSILKQNFRAYEIILIDGSTDGSGKICRQFAPDERVTILKIDSSSDKFSSWNKALEVARGDYVLFLTSNDFIFPHAANIISSICETVFHKKGDNREGYIAYDDYEKINPNIICATQNIEEDENGTIVINGIPNKKFSLKVDASFQNLNATTEWSVPDNQKLIALGTQGINSRVGTKFFKRQFLNENNIRFIGGGSWSIQSLPLSSMRLCGRKKLLLFRKFFTGGSNNLE